MEANCCCMQTREDLSKKKFYIPIYIHCVHVMDVDDSMELGYTF